MAAYCCVLEDPELKAMLGDVIDAMAAGKSATLKPIIDAAFVPESYEHQRHQAIFWGEIKPNQPYLMPMTEEQQRAQFGYNLFKYCLKRAEERIDDQQRAEQGLPPIERPRYTKADHQKRVAEAMAALRRRDRTSCPALPAVGGRRQEAPMSFWDIWNNPDLGREFDAIVDDVVANGFNRDHTARLKKLEDDSFRPISVEHQRHQAQFAGADLVIQSEAEQRNLHGIILWKQMQMAVRDRKAELARRHTGQPPPGPSE